MDNWITMHDLKILQRQQNKIVNLKERDKIYKCETETCDKEFKNNYGLKRHLKIGHQGLKTHKCNFCESFFSTSDQLKAHIQRVHEENKNYKCLSC